MAKLSVDELITKIKALPPLNVVVQRLVEVTNNPDGSARDIAKVLSGDQAIASKVLGLVNSAMYGMRQEITTISHASAILGNNSLKSLAIGLASVDVFKSYKGPVSIKDFWEHALYTATFSQILAARIGYSVPEEAFIAGLLHDVGQLVLSMFLPAKYKEALENCGDDLVLAERKAMGISHNIVGALLLNEWKLPKHLIQVVEQHHRFNGTPNYRNQLLPIVLTAEVLAHVVDRGDIGDCAERDLEEVLKFLEIPGDEFTMIFNKAKVVSNTAATFLKIPIEQIAPEEKPKDEMPATVVFGKNDFRNKWICSQLKFFGYYAVAAVPEHASYIERLFPGFILIDSESLLPQDVDAVIKHAEESEVKPKIIINSKNPEGKKPQTIARFEQLPLVFSKRELEAAIADKPATEETAPEGDAVPASTDDTD